MDLAKARVMRQENSAPAASVTAFIHDFGKQVAVKCLAQAFQQLGQCPFFADCIKADTDSKVSCQVQSGAPDRLKVFWLWTAFAVFGIA